MANARSFIINECRRYAALPYQETGNNHQKFSDIVNAYGLKGYQDSAWCATYQFALELMAFGKDYALANWCMTNSNYCGYSVSETRDKFKAKGRTGSTPRLGALVIFKQSHMGRVLSINESKQTFECGEGNTSNAVFRREGNCCAVKTYSFNDPKIDCFCYISYGDEKITSTKIIRACRAVYEYSSMMHLAYGDSHSIPPCIGDGVISCDRLPALALYILGYTDQPAGGFTVNQSDGRYMVPYLIKWGAKPIKDPSKLLPGDIVLFRNNDLTPNALWHAFVLTKFVNQNDINKYDAGSNEKLQKQQPFQHYPLNEWPTWRWFYCAYRFEEAPKNFTFTPSDVKSGSTGGSQYLANEIMVAYDMKGVKKDGKLQPLELNNVWTNGDMAAMAQWKLDRLRNGDANLCKGPYGAGEIGRADWENILSSKMPFVCLPVPDKQAKGPCPQLAQRILKANGYLGADGNPLKLDATFGPNTEYAVKNWQKNHGLPVTGKIDYDTWASMLPGLT